MGLFLPKYKLINKVTGVAVCYGDDNTITFGGDWGQCDEDGKPLYIWTDNVLAPTEQTALNNLDIQTQIDALEKKQLRSIREIALGNSDSLSYLQTIDQQIIGLRKQLTKK